MPAPFRWPQLYSRALKAEHGFSMLEPGDRILLAVSGGADSLTLLDLLAYQHRRIGAKLKFSIVPGHVPGSYRGQEIAPVARLQTICAELGHPLCLSKTRLREAAFQDCFRCSQARRKLLFDLAEEQRCNKIALGHNADDLVETFMLNILYSGRLASMAPRQPVLRNKLCIIRPLAYLWKDDIVPYARQRFGYIPRFRCPGARDSQRLRIRRLLSRLAARNPHLKANVLKAITNPRMEYLPVPAPKNRKTEPV